MARLVARQHLHRSATIVMAIVVAMVTAMVVAVVVARVSMAAEQELGPSVGRPPPQGAQLPPELPYPYRLTLPLPPDPTPTA